MTGDYQPTLAPNRVRWAIFFLGAATLVLTFSDPKPVLRLGDASEYLIMMLSWFEDHTPYTGPEGAAVYDKFVHSHHVQVPFYTWQSLQTRFVHLNDGAIGQDYHHFWFYSLIAASVYGPMSWFDAPPTSAFPVMHLVLTSGAAWLIYRQLGLWGVLALLVLILISPAIWFIDKIHSEYFTVILGCVAVAYTMRRRFALAAFWFAVAATQNPPFTTIALVCLALELWRGHTQHALLWGILSVSISTIHPLYYYLRHGVYTPQWSGQGSTVNFETLIKPLYLSYVWIDPDVGLIANWPIVMLCAVLVMILFLPRYRYSVARFGLGWDHVVLLAVAVATFSAAHAMTTNYHHGATLSVSRYATWYLPMLFPLFLIGLRLMDDVGCRRLPLYVMIISTIMCANIYVYWPGRLPRNHLPTPASALLYAHWPGLYDPIPEIFEERLRHTEATRRKPQWAVSNPTGSKVLVYLDKLEQQPRPLKPVFGRPGLAADTVAVMAMAQRSNDRTYVYLNGMQDRIPVQAEY